MLTSILKFVMRVVFILPALFVAYMTISSGILWSPEVLLCVIALSTVLMVLHHHLRHPVTKRLSWIASAVSTMMLMNVVTYYTFFTIMSLYDGTAPYYVVMLPPPDTLLFFMVYIVTSYLFYKNLQIYLRI
jgi:hypothetical protein